jgi:hypothetical protein
MFLNNSLFDRPHVSHALIYTQVLAYNCSFVSDADTCATNEPFLNLLNVYSKQRERQCVDTGFGR